MTIPDVEAMMREAPRAGTAPAVSEEAGGVQHCPVLPANRSPAFPRLARWRATRLLASALCLLGSLPAFATQAEAAIQVDAAFPGGNIVVDKIDGDTVYLRQDLRDTEGPWFYWYFRVRGAEGRTLRFQFTQGNVIGVRGPAVSHDGGRTWSWLGAEQVREGSFRCACSGGEVRFCFAIPYLESNLQAFLQQHAGDPALRVQALCRTKKGRQVELLRLGKIRGDPDHRLLLTARHHACESLASYVLEGVLEAVLAKTDDGKWLREHVELMAVPFMDKDGVEEGDQGKNRRPHDHNRDYVQKIYASVRALTERVPAWSGGKLRAAIDLHCPHIRGAHNEVIYFVGGPDAGNWARVGRFAGILQAVQQGPLAYRVSDNLPFGKSWNVGTQDATLQSFSKWAETLPGVDVATTIEFPYANAAGGEVNADSARAFGRDLARALRRYLETRPSPLAPPAGDRDS